VRGALHAVQRPAVEQPAPSAILEATTDTNLLARRSNRWLGPAEVQTGDMGNTLDREHG